MPNETHLSWRHLLQLNHVLLRCRYIYITHELVLESRSQYFPHDFKPEYPYISIWYFFNILIDFFFFFCKQPTILISIQSQIKPTSQQNPWLVHPFISSNIYSSLFSYFFFFLLLLGNELEVSPFRTDVHYLTVGRFTSVKSHANFKRVFSWKDYTSYQVANFS